MAGASRAETIRRIFAAYLANDRKFVENALSDDFRFIQSVTTMRSTSRPISSGAGRTATGSNGTSWSGFSSKAMKPLSPTVASPRGARGVSAIPSSSVFEGDKVKRIDVYFGAAYDNGAFVKQPG